MTTGVYLPSKPSPNCAIMYAPRSRVVGNWMSLRTVNTPFAAASRSPLAASVRLPSPNTALSAFWYFSPSALGATLTMKIFCRVRALVSSLELASWKVKLAVRVTFFSALPPRTTAT